MKFFTLLSFALLILMSCNGSKENDTDQENKTKSSIDIESDWEKMDLTDRVKLLKTRRYKATDKDGEAIKIPAEQDPRHGAIQHHYIFDENGFKTQDIVYNKDESIFKTNMYVYKNGLLVERYDSDPAGEINNKTFIEHDEQGNWIKETRKDGSYSKSREIKYDQDGNITNEKKYGSKGELDLEGRYEYDQDGNLIQVTWYDENESLLDKKVYKYDDRGNIILEAKYDSDDQPIDYTFERSYDDADRLSEETVLYAGDFQTKTIFKYNKKGQKIKVENYSANDELMGQQVYEYDDHGNWIYYVEYYGDSPRIILERELEYYD